MEPTVAVALNGLRRAEQMIRLHRQIPFTWTTQTGFHPTDAGTCSTGTRAATASENAGRWLQVRPPARPGYRCVAATAGYLISAEKQP